MLFLAWSVTGLCRLPLRVGVFASSNMFVCLTCIVKQRQDNVSGTGRSAWGNAGGVSPDQGGHWNGHFAERSASDGEARGETICIVPADKCGLVIGKGITTVGIFV